MQQTIGGEQTTVKELIEALSSQPQDAVVELALDGKVSEALDGIESFAYNA